MPRLVWLATAIAWAVSSALLLARGATSSAALLDWAADIAYTAAWLLFAPAMILATRLVPSQTARWLGAAIGAGAVVAGIASLMRRLASVDGISTWYVDGILLATILLVPLAYLFARDRSNQLSVVALALFLGVGFIAGAVGGVLVAVAFAALAYRPAWFHPRRRPVVPEMPVEIEPA
ncbi:MAG TPA: hypothetical protein VHR16_05540 [Candidatus Limnocylindrales bacterium]|nr:hypothetical protein [Candidatus Limnocylindrales bacterium]